MEKTMAEADHVDVNDNDAETGDDEFHIFIHACSHCKSFLSSGTIYDTNLKIFSFQLF